jgi:hypothetical protein
MYEKFVTPILFMAALFCLLVACTINEPTFEPGAGAEATPTPAATVTDLPIATAMPSSTPVPTATAWDNLNQEEISLTATSAMATAYPDLVPAPGEVFTPTPVPPFPGMVYQTQTGLWQVGNDWPPKHLTSFANGVLSPDGTQVVYADQGDLWLTQPSDGTTRQLTTTPDHMEHSPQWWSAHPDIVLFQTIPMPQGEAEQNNGYLAALSLSEGWLKQLEQVEPAFATFAPAPDGLHIAYDRVGQPWVYHWEGEVAEPFDAAAYTISEIVSWERLAAPSWSSDSRQLAWSVAVQGEIYPAANGAWQVAAAVFNIAEQTVTILHPHDNVGRDGWYPPVAWSPDNQWLAFTTEDVDPARQGLWVLKTDGSEEHHLGNAYQPVWSPDGQWLTYQGVTPQLIATTSWYALNLFVYENGTIVDWR